MLPESLYAAADITAARIADLRNGLRFARNRGTRRMILLQIKATRGADRQRGVEYIIPN